MNVTASGNSNEPGDRLDLLNRPDKKPRPVAWDRRFGCVRLGEIEIDLTEQEARHSGRSTVLTSREVAILQYLLAHRGSWISAEELLERALGYPAHYDSPGIIREHVNQLREKIEPNPALPRLLLSLPRLGYRLAIAT
ncbi:MAG: winged helix-turn-helix transcriptional regulator [Cyanobacteria bacterium NC_groundwater_1444_Ag_S-0.65um_54_12]|nr:winged helix-turn-helix transcriptional regulator [Cyanobacteria bacterium NC_groundwater_1444_Ag_S-0.65um_54_12]